METTGQWSNDMDIWSSLPLSILGCASAYGVSRAVEKERKGQVLGIVDTSALLIKHTVGVSAHNALMPISSSITLGDDTPLISPPPKALTSTTSTPVANTAVSRIPDLPANVHTSETNGYVVAEVVALVTVIAYSVSIVASISGIGTAEAVLRLLSPRSYIHPCSWAPFHTFLSITHSILLGFVIDHSSLRGKLRKLAWALLLVLMVASTVLNAAGDKKGSWLILGLVAIYWTYSIHLCMRR